MANPVVNGYFWYEQPLKGDCHEQLQPYIQYLQKDNQGHVSELLRNYRMYYGRQVSNFSPYGYHRTMDAMPSEGSSINLIASCVDTVVSKIAGTSRPAVTFVTTAGDWLQQRRSKQLTRFLDGIFYQAKIHDIGPQLVRDAAAFGDAYLHVFSEAGRVKMERVVPWEIFYDLAEGIRGKPRQIFRVTAITRDKLKRIYKTKRAAISKANPIRSRANPGSGQFTDDLLEVVEAIRLPSHKGADDGRRAIIIDGATLVLERWDRDEFPYIKYTYCQPPLGMYGISVATQLVRSQVYVNRLLKIIDRSLATLAAPKIWMAPGGGANGDHWTREIGGIIKSAIKPELLTQQILPAEVYQHLADVIQRAYEIVGISQQTASAVKPSGVTAAIAMETLDDIQGDRLSIPSLAYEELFVDAARAAIAVMKEIYEDEKSYEVKVPSKGGLQAIDWKDLDLDDEACVLQVDVVAGITKQVPGKLQFVSNLQALGVIAPFQVPRLLRNPDLDQILDAQTAMQDLIYQRIDNILDEGMDGYEAPDGLDDLNLSIQLFTQALAKATYDGAPPDRLRLLRQYIVSAKQKLTTPPSAAPAMGPQSVPPGQPSQAPVAPLAATLKAS